MKRTLLLVLVFVLFAANVFKFLFFGESATIKRHEPINDTGDMLVDVDRSVPSWLLYETEFSDDRLRVNIFAPLGARLPAANVAPAKPVGFANGKVARKIMLSSDMVKSDVIEVLAINRSDNSASAMVSYRGKVKVVFVGDELAGTYVVSAIEDGRVYFEGISD